MNRTVLIVITATAVALAGCGADDDIAAPRASSTPTATTTPEPVATAPPRVRETPEINGDYELSCDYDLGDFDSYGTDYKFIGGGTLSNTGNVGIVARVTYKWRLLGAGSITKHKTYRIRRGQDREIDISFPATSEQIDAHQSAHGKCSTDVEITDTFGKPPFE